MTDYITAKTSLCSIQGRVKRDENNNIIEMEVCVRNAVNNVDDMYILSRLANYLLKPKMDQIEINHAFTVMLIKIWYNFQSELLGSMNWEER